MLPEMEWLVFCQGRPQRFGWIHTTRVDALARTARAALASGCPCHFLFEDRAMLSLEPNFLGCGSPWGLLSEASEARFRELLLEIRSGVNLPGAFWFKPRPRIECLRGVLFGKCGEPRFGMALAFRESGNLLLGSETAPVLMEASWPLPRAVGIIGGVRDVSRVEEHALEAAYPQLWFQRCILSLGRTPELTSKCVKTVGALQNCGLLAPAVQRCWTGSQSMPPPPAQPHGALHLVILAPTSLRSFAASPSAATLIVDAFVGSRRRYSSVLLTIVGSDSSTVSLRQAGQSLRERGALEVLSECLDMKRNADIKKALLDGQRLLRTGSPSDLRVLHADDSMPPLVPPSAAGLPANRKPANVAVVFAGARQAAKIRAACAVMGVKRFERASVGGSTFGPAYVGMLHNSGLLAPAIRSPVQHSLLLPSDVNQDSQWPALSAEKRHTRRCRGRCALCWRDKAWGARMWRTVVRREEVGVQEGLAGSRAPRPAAGAVASLAVQADSAEAEEKLVDTVGLESTGAPGGPEAKGLPPSLSNLTMSGLTSYVVAGTAPEPSESTISLDEVGDTPNGLSDQTESGSDVAVQTLRC